MNNSRDVAKLCDIFANGNIVTGFHSDGTPMSRRYYETKFCHHLPE
jgi:hypothetical protein